MTSRQRDFVRMNPTIYHGSQDGEDIQDFLDGLNKVLSLMAVKFSEKAELGWYEFKEFALVQYSQWKDNTLVESGPIEW